MRKGILAAGIILIIIGVVVPQLPLFEEYGVRYSLSEANELCRSALGQLGRAFSEEAAEACGYVSALTSLFTIISIVGAGLIIYGAIAKKKEEETK